MDRSDWNLLVLSAAGGAHLSPAQLQKCLFLLGKALPQVVGTDSFYNFRPYNYGAFDEAVYFDAGRLQQRGLARIDKTNFGWNVYAASPQGLAVAQTLRQQIPAEVTDYVTRLVAWARSLSFADLVRAVYEAYPETRANSIFRG
jgi:hypothetical protein